MIAHTLFLGSARAAVPVIVIFGLALHAADDHRRGPEGRQRRVRLRDQPAARLDTDRLGDRSGHGVADEPAPRLPADVDATTNFRPRTGVRRRLVSVAVAKPESEHSAAGRPTCRLVRGPVRPVKPAMVGRPEMDGNVVEASIAWVREQRDIGGSPGILPKLGTVPLAEIMVAAGCCKASASDYRRGQCTPHVLTGGVG